MINKKVLLIIGLLTVLFLSGCSSEEVVVCDKLTMGGVCLSNCFFSTSYMDDEYWHSTNLVSEPYVREYCGVVVGGRYKQK